MPKRDKHVEKKGKGGWEREKHAELEENLHNTPEAGVKKMMGTVGTMK